VEDRGPVGLFYEKIMKSVLNMQFCGRPGHRARPPVAT
jgi:hypothetical protein